MTEQWKTIPRHPNSEVSDRGNVQYKADVALHGHTKRARPLKLGGKGYYYVLLNGRTESVGRIMLEAFIGPAPSAGHVADHINENRLDNRLENLQWLTQSQNIIKGGIAGRQPQFYCGELWLMRKLANAEVSQNKIASMFHCTQSMVSHVKNDLQRPCKQVQHLTAGRKVPRHPVVVSIK